MIIYEAELHLTISGSAIGLAELLPLGNSPRNVDLDKLPRARPWDRCHIVKPTRPRLTARRARGELRGGGVLPKEAPTMCDKHRPLYDHIRIECR